MKKYLCILLACVLVLALAAGLYVGDYYHADTQAISAMTGDTVTGFGIWGDGTMAFIPEGEEWDTALIFYPGGKVEYRAYEPLMVMCAERGILCLLVEMPCNLAVLDMNAADRVREWYPQVENWYMAGHSLGGSMAASYAAEHSDEIDGLILLGAYSTVDVTVMPVLSIYGSEDGVLNMEKYEKYRVNLPQDVQETVISGGCHAWFGVYGPQEGDGTPTITNLEQLQQTAELIAAFVE